MKEYIEKAAAMEFIIGLTIVDPAVAQYANAVYYNLQNLPAANVVEVVRCDHCERRYEEDGEYFCSRTDMSCADDDFCSYGARMDKEDEHEVG